MSNYPPKHNAEVFLEALQSGSSILETSDRQILGYVLYTSNR